MTTSTLNLSPIVEGYKWLEANPEHFDMIRFLCKQSEQSEESRVILCSTPTKPECGTTLCLAGAILLANAIEKGEPYVYISSEPSIVLHEVMELLAQVNQWEEPDYSHMSPYLGIKQGLYDIFVGDIFLDYDGGKYPHIDHMSAIGLKDLERELNLLFHQEGYPLLS